MIYKVTLATPAQSLYRAMPSQISETEDKKLAYKFMFENLEKMEIGSRAIMEGFLPNGTRNSIEGHRLEKSELFGTRTFPRNPCAI